MAGATTKKASDAAAAVAAAEAAEALEREAAAASKAQQEADEEAASRGQQQQQQQQQDELDVVAVGAVAHVIRRAFRAFYASPEAAAEDCNENTVAEAPEGGGDASEDTQPEAAATDKLPSPRMELQELDESPFVPLARARKDAIALALEQKHARAKALLKFMETRQQEAAEADARIAEQLSQRGLVVKAQIPVGPTHLRLDEHELRAAVTDTGTDFGELADSLLHAKTLVAEYEQRRQETSGNTNKATRRTAAGEESGENGLEHVGYLDTTMSANSRNEATLEQHRNHIAGVKVAHADHRAKASPEKDDMHQDGDSEPGLASTALASLSASQLEQQQGKESTAQMNPVEKRKNLVILERMQTKLDFVRNPRYAVPDQSKVSVGGDSADPASSVKPCFDIVPKPPIMFTDYDIGGIYEQVVYVRNTGSLSRRARILPPATIVFSMASISFPVESGMVAPGMHVELRVRFAPDSRADYKDSFIVQHETEQSVAVGSTGTPGAAGTAEMVVPLMARREPPELTLPLVVRAQNTLVGGRSVTPLLCKNLGGKARFWLMSEPAWSRLEHLQVASHGISPARAAVEMLGGDYTLGTTMDVGPFRITPNDIELEKSESVTFDLVYSPSAVGEQRERFVMVCDNCLVRVFQVVGRGCQVDVAATCVNDALIDTAIAEMGPLDRLFFPEGVLVNSRAQQTIAITNDTPLDVKYSWKIHPIVEQAQTGGRGEDKDKAVVLSLSSGWTPPYRINPESGVFALSSSQEFTIEFLPVEARTYVCQATLMINDVPACSMPGPGQMAHLKAAFQTREDHLISPQAAAKAAARKLRDAMPGFSIQLRGRGRLGSFTIAPALNDSWIPLEDDGLQQPGNAGCESVQLLQQKQKYSTSVVLKNQCDARVAFCWDLARLRQRHLAASGGPSASTTTLVKTSNPPSFELALIPDTGELDPLSQQRVELTFTPLCVGSFSLSVPCRIIAPNDTNDAQAPRFERWLLLEGHVAGAEIEIVTPEVDFGLVLVGASAESFITIRNPSRSVPTHWRILHLEGSTSSYDPGTNQQQQPAQSSLGPKLRRSSSKESVASRHSAISSSSGNETERSLFTSRDILPRASVAFAPENGELAPGETFKVKATCMAGSLQERFRGLFSCQAAPERNFFGSNTTSAHAAVSARAEIQCPNVFLSATRLPLGTTYMGVEIHRTIELVNVSNLEAAFKFVEPEGASRAFTIKFSPKQGTIHSKERLVVTLNYTPRQVGRFTVVLACSVRGLAAPLGFEVSSNHKGLVLSYELVQAPPSAKSSSRKEGRTIDTPSLTLPKSPKEIAMERGIPLADCDLEPETNPLNSVPKLAFGDSVPLGERRPLCLLIRNFSGIEALVDLEAKNFPAAAVNIEPSSSGGTGRFLRQDSVEFLPSSPSTSPSKSRHQNRLGRSRSARSLGSTRTGSYRTYVSALDKPVKPGLSDNGNRFQSDNGRAYLRQRGENVEDRQVLREGRGVAFQLYPARIHIPPWEQAVVRVTCFNNMPGTYVDDIVSRATGAPPVFLHANVRVVGTPLAVDRNCVGLHFGKPVPEGRPQALLRQPTLSFGALCVRAPTITRTLRVVNRGPQRARVKWKLVENGREDQLVNVTLRVDFGSRLQLRITPCDEHNTGATAFPFTVEPQTGMVPPFSTTPFRVTFVPPKEGVGAPRALMLADAHWYDTSAEDNSNSDSTASISTPTSVVSLDTGNDPRQEDSSSPTRHSNNSPNTPAHVAAGKAFTAVRIANAIVRKPGPVLESTPASSYSPKCLRVLLSADVIEPELSIDKPREQLQQTEALPPPLSGRNGVRKNSTPPTTTFLPRLLAPYHIKFTTWSTLMSTSAAQHLFHRRELFLVNQLGSRVTFRLECEGPFAVANADSLAPRHPLSMADLPPAHRRSTAQGESYMFILPPQMSVRIDLRFLPSASLPADSSASTASKSKPKPLLQQQQQPLHYQIDGELRVKFATKSVQMIRLATVVLRPAIVVSPSVFFFGRVHLSASRFVLLRLANPTVVPARFSVQHVPRPKPVSRAQQQEMHQHHAHLTDDPAVFTFSKLAGELRGPTTSLKSSGGYLSTTDSTRDLLGEDATTTHPLVHAPLELRVEFHPRESGRRYKSRFRFTVEHGRDFEVVLEGTGHLDEVDNPRDGDRPLVRVRELENSYHIFRRS
ncbi:Deleted in lung and esophageal cancer protein 1 [Phytophthora pseudosyringae]|uniref:Deleted in lung and esophageal cancer protein 1 n=1 Tax=Phytophthora pseudosyringae TaxID=221518 RepID=A0A8T1VU08_9STRA|nr:Deleted in lung and esophageal cancer protein 1 [Phytophthora pseudosyringae]